MPYFVDNHIISLVRALYCAAFGLLVAVEATSIPIAE
jgi:hypothetical protein